LDLSTFPFPFLGIAAGAFLLGAYLISRQREIRRREISRMEDSDTASSKKGKVISFPAEEQAMRRRDRMIHEEKKCPCCGAFESMLAGPRGGVCQNIMCSECKARFNVTPVGVELLSNQPRANLIL